MLYRGYQAQSDVADLISSFAAGVEALLAPFAGVRPRLPVAYARAGARLATDLRVTHQRPDFRITGVEAGNRIADVREEAVFSTPFGTLLHFAKDVDAAQPKVLVVAPLSGHFATLLRNTAQTLLRDHDVYITDWHNARDVPLSAGRFGFDDYVDHIIRFLEVLGPGVHVVAVCQPCVQVLAAAALMAADGHPAQPASMTLMAGPVDVRINPTEVNALANSKPLSWFESELIHAVPERHAGAGRLVYPGFIQLSAFMAMNPQRHTKQFQDYFTHLVRGEADKAETIRVFYEEYLAVLDLTAEFYLETIRIVFQDALLARGALTVAGRPVKPALIRRTALLTVEGERDDICSLGQTAAAHDLCTGLRPFRKRHHMQVGVGHYGVFSGRKWDGQIYPIVRNHILASE